MALAANALTLVATCEAEIGGLTGGSQDALLERYINAASEKIAQYLGYILYNDSAVVEKVAGSDDAFIYIDRTPLNSITSIIWLGDGSTVSSGDYEIWKAGQGAIYNANGWNDSRISMTDFERYQVTFDGGWVTPQQGGTRDLPFDLENVCIDMVTTMWRQKGADAGIKSESILSTSVTYDRSHGGITPTMQEVLDSYKRYDRLTEVD